LGGDTKDYPSVGAELQDTDSSTSELYAPGDTTTGASTLNVIAEGTDPTKLVTNANTDTCVTTANNSGTWYATHVNTTQTGQTEGSPTPVLYNIQSSPGGSAYTGALTLSGTFQVANLPAADTNQIDQGCQSTINVVAQLNILDSQGQVQSTLGEVTVSMQQNDSSNYDLVVNTWSQGTMSTNTITNFTGKSNYNDFMGTTVYPPLVYNWSVHLDAGQAPYGVQESVQYSSALQTTYNATSTTGTNSFATGWTFTIDSISGS
jgi:hypothetical protein